MRNLTDNERFNFLDSSMQIAGYHRFYTCTIRLTHQIKFYAVFKVDGRTGGWTLDKQIIIIIALIYRKRLLRSSTVIARLLENMKLHASHTHFGIAKKTKT